MKVLLAKELNESREVRGLGRAGTVLRNRHAEPFLTHVSLGYGAKALRNLSEPLPGEGRPSRRGEDNGLLLGFLAAVAPVYLPRLHLK